ncbi:hypothetical protein P7K49_028920 [Saguinus oedipus]|uniref:Uncharacterized protein n=1 Tax=Saguinus oedipus TaxID=9490 RepID=A0ABQ9U7T2_SAGOE|nr:hypothetical protein P7K49_028920 [Saguinus oedipus]
MWLSSFLCIDIEGRQPLSTTCLISCASPSEWQLGLLATGRSPELVTRAQDESSRCSCDNVAFIFITVDPVGGKPPFSHFSPHSSSQSSKLSPRRGCRFPGLGNLYGNLLS